MESQVLSGAPAEHDLLARRGPVGGARHDSDAKGGEVVGLDADLDEQWVGGIDPLRLQEDACLLYTSGSRALAAKKVLVKRLVAIEDLGNIEILFTDKTGTLTDGKITFARSLDASGRDGGRPMELGLVCNEASLTTDGPVGGNALDQALWSAPVAGSGGEVASTVAKYRLSLIHI